LCLPPRPQTINRERPNMAENTFEDPVVRCVDCQRLIFHDEIQKFGLCPDCGTRKVRNVLTLRQGEYDALKAKGHDGFLAKFEGVPL